MQKKRNIKKSRIDIEKARARRKLTAISVLSVVVLAVLALCFLLMAPMFNIKNIVCEGNDKISYDAIVDASQIKTGGNIFLTNLSSPKKNVESLEYVEDCQVSRVFPDTVKFTITERQPAAYFSIGDFLTVTDTNGRVVDTVTNNDDVYQITSSKIKEEILWHLIMMGRMIWRHHCRIPLEKQLFMGWLSVIWHRLWQRKWRFQKNSAITLQWQECCMT